jgi:GDP-4-dehydro-6-deoxy-D-mannose reductase
MWIGLLPQFKMRVLITGITGFAGSHLADFLLTQDGVEVSGIKRWRSRTENIEHLLGRVDLLECDIMDASAVRSTIASVKPDKIFHLAAQTFVPPSWTAPSVTITTNIVGTLNIFEGVRQAGIDPWILAACSSDEYGKVEPDEIPIKETNPLRPLSPYSVSKIGQDMLSYQYFRSYGLKIIRTRAFNHTGPRQVDVFVCSDFAKQIADIEKGLKKPVMRVGNLESRRDFLDVRDVVRGYWTLLEKGTPGEAYNLCSGRAITIQEILDILLSLSKVKIDVQQDPMRMRPSDVPLILGDGSKILREVGWEAEIDLEQTLQDTLDYWRMT